jgi:hypothetical protein
VALYIFTALALYLTIVGLAPEVVGLAPGHAGHLRGPDGSRHDMRRLMRSGKKPQMDFERGAKSGRHLWTLHLFDKFCCSTIFLFDNFFVQQFFCSTIFLFDNFLFDNFLFDNFLFDNFIVRHSIFS